MSIWKRINHFLKIIISKTRFLGFLGNDACPGHRMQPKSYPGNCTDYAKLPLHWLYDMVQYNTGWTTISCTAPHCTTLHINYDTELHSAVETSFYNEPTGLHLLWIGLDCSLPTMLRCSSPGSCLPVRRTFKPKNSCYWAPLVLIRSSINAKYL